MLAPSIPRSRIFPLFLICAAAVAFAASPAIVGCLIKTPTLFAADLVPQPAPLAVQSPKPDAISTPNNSPFIYASTKTSEAVVLASPNGKYSITLSATNEGASITISEGDRKVDLVLTGNTGNIFLRSGDCTYAATSSKNYSASTVGHAATGRLTTSYCTKLGDRIESAFACYALQSGSTSANAALYSDDNGVGKLQLIRGANHVTVDCPEEDEQKPHGLFREDDARETRVPESHMPSDGVARQSASRVTTRTPQ